MSQNAVATSDSENQRRRQITRAVIQCVAEDGIYGATVRRVAGRAGVSTGMVSYYFPTKKALIAEAIAAAALEMYELLGQLEGSGFGPGRLDTVGELFLVKRSQSFLPLSFWLEFWSEATRDDELRRHFLESLLRNNEYYRKSLGVAAEQGKFPSDPEEIDLAARMISALLRGLNIEASLGAEEMPAKLALRVFRYSLNLLFGRELASGEGRSAAVPEAKPAGKRYARRPGRRTLP
jgi:AcrR family transcriptional regulator